MFEVNHASLVVSLVRLSNLHRAPFLASTKNHLLVKNSPIVLGQNFGRLNWVLRDKLGVRRASQIIAVKLYFLVEVVLDIATGLM